MNRGKCTLETFGVFMAMLLDVLLWRSRLRDQHRRQGDWLARLRAQALFANYKIESWQAFFPDAVPEAS